MPLKKFYSFILLTFTFLSSAQTATVEKSVFNAQAGVLGVYASHEAGLAGSFALRTEVGLDAVLFGNYNYKLDVALTPVIRLEPRWYYNLAKRGEKGKSTANNSGNFLTLALIYHPDLFVVSGYDNIYVPDQIDIVPKWGIRRHIAGSNFNYELGIGIGYKYYFLKQYGYKENEGEATLDLHIRIGYTF
ncbi:MAG TPA: hypothetical protein VEA37_10065 [Flavobacterium sp.]|nr:hypothetical protein [Flavobacterium sp.]